jgi:aminopeptidase N
MRYPSFASLTALSLALLLPACSDDEPPKCHVAGCDPIDPGTPLPQGNIDGLVKRYDYAFDLTTAGADALLTVDVAPPGGNCWAVSNEAVALTDATWNGSPNVNAALKEGTLHACGNSVRGLDTLALGVHVPEVPQKTWFKLDVGFSRKKDLAGGEFSYLLSWVGGCDRFGPCDDDPSRINDFHFEVTHPKGTVVLCPGTRITDLGPPDATRTVCDVKGAPTYSAFAIAADPLWVSAPFGTFAGVHVVFYEVPGGGLASALDPARVGAFMEWVTGLFGDFPYGDELRVAGAPTAWAGFEHPGNIILNQSLKENGGASGTFQVLMHEMVHQWAGNRTTLASASDFVWKEATAEYIPYVFADENMPKDVAIARRAYWDAISPQSTYHPRPTDDPPPDVQDFYSDVYGPGPMVLYLQLEALIGRPAVLQGIIQFLSQPGGRSVEALKDALAEASGKNLDAYFNAWVFGQGKPEWPAFEIETSQAGGETTVTVTQKNPSGTLYPCAVEVELQSADGATRALVDFGLEPKSATATASVKFSEPITKTVLDPDYKLIASRVGDQPILQKQKVWIF